MLLCDVQTLDVEAESGDRRAPEAELRGGGGESLQAGLRVENARQQERPHHAIEGAAHEVPSIEVVEEARAHEVPRLGQYPAGDREVGAAVELTDDARDLVERIRQVDVGEHAMATPRGEHAARHGVALAAVARVAQHADPVMLAREVLEHQLRLDLGRAVVDEEHLEAIGRLRREAIDLLERIRKLVRRIVHGDHERQGRCVRRRVEHRCLETSGDGRSLRVGPAYIRAPRNTERRTPATWPTDEPHRSIAPSELSDMRRREIARSRRRRGAGQRGN